MTESTDDSDDDEGDIEIASKHLDGLVGSKGRLETPKRPNRAPPKEVKGTVAQAQAGPSNSGSIKGKEKAKVPTTPAPVQEQEEKNEVVSSFKPMSRSIMSGWKLSVSRSPSPPTKRARTDSPGVEIFVDEQPDPAVTSQAGMGDEHFQAPDLFSTSLIPRKKTQRKLRDEDQKQAEEAVKEDTMPDPIGEERALLLPEHITLESAEERKEEDLEEGNKSLQDVEGLHILDDSKAKVSHSSFSVGQGWMCRAYRDTSIQKLERMILRSFSRRRIRVGYA